MSNEKSGNASVIKVDTLSGGSYNTPTNQMDMTLTLEMDTLESTNKSSSRNRTYEIGNTGWSWSVSGRIDGTAAGDTDGFIVLQDSWQNKAKFDFQFLETGTADTYTGTGIVQSISRTYPQNGIQEFTVSGVGDGEINIG